MQNENYCDFDYRNFNLRWSSTIIGEEEKEEATKTGDSFRSCRPESQAKWSLDEQRLERLTALYQLSIVKLVRNNYKFNYSSYLLITYLIMFPLTRPSDRNFTRSDPSRPKPLLKKR